MNTYNLPLIQRIPYIYNVRVLATDRSMVNTCAYVMKSHPNLMRRGRIVNENVFALIHCTALFNLYAWNTKVIHVGERLHTTVGTLIWSGDDTIKAQAKARIHRYQLICVYKHIYASIYSYSRVIRYQKE